MSGEIETYTEYGVFVQHGSAEILQVTFGRSEAVAIWRIAHPNVHVTSVRSRQVTKQIGMWSEPIDGDPS